MSEISSRTSDRGHDIESSTAEKAFEDGFDTDITKSPEDKEAGGPLTHPRNANADAEPPSEQPELDQRPNYTVFTEWEKRGIVVGAAIGAFFSPLTAQIYLPALNVLAADFDVTVSQINLTVTTYMIFQGLTPMFVGSLADTAGRRPAYFICFIIYICANIGCALAPSYPALLVLRMLQSAGSSTTVALCQAVVADIITSAERGHYVGYTSLPILLAPAVGPIIGGILAQFVGWRWIFWLLAILAGFVLVLHAFFLPETCREIVGDGSVRPHPVYRTGWQLCKDALRRRRERRKNKDNGGGGSLTHTASRTSTRRSFRVGKFNIWQSVIILAEKEMFVLLSYGSIIFTGFYCIATVMPTQLGENYGFDEIQIGLMYLPMVGGSMGAAFVNGKLMNWNYRRHCKLRGVPFERSKQQDLDDFPIERARLEIAVPMLIITVLVTFGWGWAFQYRAHIAVPCVLLFIAGWAVVGFSNAINVLLVDVNPGKAGAATASNNLTRCLVGAAATAVIGPMINGVGIGWAFTILGFIYIAFSPMIFLVMNYGIQWRKEKRDRQAAKERKNEATTQS
ncbi:major facilitator superfamily transporter [Annulohypoxylon maeteangense]|uniref:major facilitator superfamily transporter n=1 Tax=Annulohypoxylon maeteangense TaxID=1927788 RepID=UPI0020083C42|nr:major facilitator superfamily transporter [Annulohypoxylon maeteangense]KAI0889845.1 major facilitator superfamily transporter [Annulohypoxylon maeteangense]